MKNPEFRRFTDRHHHQGKARWEDGVNCCTTLKEKASGGAGHFSSGTGAKGETRTSVGCGVGTEAPGKN